MTVESTGSCEEKVAAAERAFAEGDFLTARAMAKRVLDLPDLFETVRTRAERILDAIRPDPVAIVLGAACLLGFVVTVYVTLGR